MLTRNASRSPSALSASESCWTWCLAFSQPWPKSNGGLMPWDCSCSDLAPRVVIRKSRGHSLLHCVPHSFALHDYALATCGVSRSKLSKKRRVNLETPAAVAAAVATGVLAAVAAASYCGKLIVTRAPLSYQHRRLSSGTYSTSPTSMRWKRPFPR